MGHWLLEPGSVNDAPRGEALLPAFAAPMLTALDSRADLAALFVPVVVLAAFASIMRRRRARRVSAIHERIDEELREKPGAELRDR